MRQRRAACVAMAIALCVGAERTGHGQQSQQPQPSQPVFRTTTRLVVHSVTVKDRDGKVIEGLTARDFVVTEDGQPQDIAFVEFQRLLGAPAAEPAAAAVEPAPQQPAATTPPVPAVAPVTQIEISTPPAGGIKYQDKRLIVLYFDLSAMGPFDQVRAYTNARKYIETQMTPADLVAIMTFQGGAVRVKSDFSGDRAALREVIQVLIYGEDADGDGIPDNPDQGTDFGQNDAEFNIFNTDRQLSALQTAVTMLRPLPEQKTLIYFGSGLRLNGSDNQAQMRATVNAAIRANVTVNPIDARGLVAMAPLGDATQRSPGGIGTFSGTTATAQMLNFQRSQDTLFALAKDTGGKAMFDYNDLSLGIVQAAEVVTSYYIIGYYSANLAKDGKYRRVRVTLNGNAAAQLAYRQGYYADKEFAKFSNADKERQLEEALMLDDPVTEIQIAMEVNYFRLNSAEYFVPVAVKMPGSELTLARRRGAARLLLDFIGEVKDEFGFTYKNIRDKTDVRLDDQTATQVANRPIRYETGFTLLPGKYVIKFLARDAETGRIGTYQTNFTIPNLDREQKRLPISTVVLSSQRLPIGDEIFNAQTASVQNANPMVHDGQTLIPSVTRVFSKSRDLLVFLQAYQQKAATTQPMVAFVTFYRGDVKALETAPLAVTAGLEPRSKAVSLRFSIPLESLPIGRYDCQVTVLEPTGQKAAFWQAPVVVVP